MTILATPRPPLPQPQRVACVACGGAPLEVVEVVSVDRLARAWAAHRRMHNPPTNGSPHVPTMQEVADWRQSIRDAVGAEQIRFDRCGACGLEMADPAQSWPDGTYPEDEHYPIRWEFGRFLDDLQDRPRRLLELGCGAGQFLAAAVARGHQPVGIDFNPVAVEAARAKGLDVVHGGFEHLRTHLATTGSDAGFDAVALFHVIEHLPAPAELFTALGEFVRPGTLLGISCPGPNRFTRLIREQQVGQRDFWDYPPHHVLRWTAPALRAFLAANGWEAVAVEEEPVSLVNAAAQAGHARALWRGYAGSRWRTRLSILFARMRLMASWRRRGLSLYVLARRVG